MVGICADADTELFYTCVRSRPGCLQQLRPVGERNIVMCMSVCVSVYLPSKKSPGIRIRSSPIYYACNPWPWLCPPLVALRYVIQYVQYNTSLPVLWMTSCMHTQWPVIGDTNMACTQWLNRGQHGFCTPAYTQTESQGGSTGPVRSLISTIASLLVADPRIVSWLMTDINECAVNNGGCQHDCCNTPGSFTCRCPPGYQLTADARHCQGEHSLYIDAASAFFASY